MTIFTANKAAIAPTPEASARNEMSSPACKKKNGVNNANAIVRSRSRR